jgi:FkbM family methyltransferase
MIWIIILAIIRLPRKWAPGIDKAKLLADITTKICKKETIMHTEFGVFYGNLSMVANINPNYEKNIHSILIDNYQRNIHRDGRIFINVGTHIGKYLIDMTKNYGYESCGFEPTPSSYKYLQISAILSGIWEKVHLYNVGLGDKDEILDFYQSSVAAYNTFCNDQRILNTEKTQAKVMRFDDMGLGLDAKNVALILMDVEGFEYHALNGMKMFLSSLKNVDVVVEIHENCPNKKKVLDLMRTIGYSTTQIDSGNWLFKRGDGCAA